jgi:hypothetical protein
MKVTLDRFEGEFAVLLVRDDESISIDFPTCLLPKKCKEGDILDLTITRDVEETAEAKKRVSNLIEKLKKKNLE